MAELIVSKAKKSAVPCCPTLETDQPCDVLDYHYRLTHNTVVVSNDQRQIVPVEVTIHARIERCPGPLALGDLVYTNTLLPGEKVRLFTSDRRTRFSFDSSTKVSYRNEQSSEERFYMASVNDFMSDVSVRDSSTATNTAKGSSQGHAGTSSLLGSIFNGPSVNVSGSYDSASTSTFLRELSQHASSSHRRAELGTRAASSVSIGEVQTRSHSEGESQDHFESSSREFANPNHCHAVTFFFYQINKTQTVKFTLEAIERRVIDPAADTRVTNNPFVSQGDVSAIPNGVLATDVNRLKVEEAARASVAARDRDAVAPQIAGLRAFAFQRLEPLPIAIRQQALQQVDNDLIGAGLLDKNTGKISPEVQRQFSFELRSSLPTPGVLVKGCLDECDICEPAVMTGIELELERKRLENELLKRKIELLDKAQEYRCCPAGEEPESSDDILS
ncbi:hypothetical protein HUU05_21310 [candidate division KSB1 bacterium]|nr:hypothetical protein [candidate division KSB1 bacterium]